MKSRQHFNPELVAMATAVNYKGSRNVEIRSFSMRGICASHLEREREKMGCERESTTHCCAGLENATPSWYVFCECQLWVTSQVIADDIL